MDILGGGGPDRTLQAVRVVPHSPGLPPPHKTGQVAGGGGSSGEGGASRVAWSVWSGFPSHKIILAKGSHTRLLATLAALRNRTSFDPEGKGNNIGNTSSKVQVSKIVTGWKSPAALSPADPASPT